ncbi:pseudouridine synthase family protein [Pelagicoccus albus]|uniref:RNA pseudouridine synthase n=1 Tax=Pelagicoccus albus TaxID=415222 RepID=A0A7X1B439_9BACT|nr:RNA pseudouridine synthase [Pelagicoccus albus]MBC2605260.1 RNA pseudouridine synthase [Pelagicoccus albus]
MSYAQQVKSLPWTRGVKVLECDLNGVVAVEKPAGTLSHPNRKGDKGRALLDAGYDEKQQAYLIGGDEENALVYLLNRLDSATSGVVLLSLNKPAADSVLDAFKQKKVKKIYQALVFGFRPGGSPVWRDKLSVRKAEGGVRAGVGGGLHAETKLVKAEGFPGPLAVSRLTLMPVTGRTHQLRIQTSKRNMPIVGDRTYGDFSRNKVAAKNGLKRLCLHCVKTEFEYKLAHRFFRFSAQSKCPF